MAEWLIASYSVRQKKLFEKAKAEAEKKISGKTNADKSAILKLSGKYVKSAYRNGVEFGAFLEERQGRKGDPDDTFTDKTRNKIYKKFDRFFLNAKKLYTFRKEQMKSYKAKPTKQVREMYFNEYKNAILKALSGLIEDAGQEGITNALS